MSGGPAAQQTAQQYIRTQLSGSIADLSYVGGQSISNGRRLGFKLAWQRDFTIVGLMLGVLLGGLLGLLISILLGLVLLLVGFPGALVMPLAFLGTVGVAGLAGYSGAYPIERERLSVTVSPNNSVTMVNRDLSEGEFSRALGRSYDRQTDQFSEMARTASMELILHKFVDRFVNSNDNNRP